MRFHWQNLNERDERTGRRKRGWHGRAWWGKWRLEWSIPAWFWHLDFSVNGGDSNSEAQGSIGCGLFAVWLSRDGLPVNRYGRDHVHEGKTYRIREEREFKLSVHDRTLWFVPWGRAMEWRRDDPWWVRGITWHPLDTLLGKQQHEHRILEDWKDMLVPMPEGCYPVRMRREEREWKRPRWPWWPSRILQEYVEIQIEGGIPFEGKGENSWDCGEDGLWGCSSSGTSYEKAVGHVVETVLNDRRRYGGGHIHRGRGPLMATPRQPVQQ